MNKKQEKYKQLILACIKYGSSSDGKIPKTKLAKIIYLADFLYYYENLKPISGLQYKKYQYGPVPSEYLNTLELMSLLQEITIESKGKAELVKANEEVSFDLLRKKELKTIQLVAEKWKNKQTGEVVEFTHKQLPWKISRDLEDIPYELIIQEDEENVY